MLAAVARRRCVRPLHCAAALSPPPELHSGGLSLCTGPPGRGVPGHLRREACRRTLFFYSSALEICFFSPFVCLNQYALNAIDFVLRIKVPCDFIFGLWPFQPRPPGGLPGGAPVSCGTPRSCGIVGAVVGRVFTSWPHRGPGTPRTCPAQAQSSHSFKDPCSFSWSMKPTSGHWVCS